MGQSNQALLASALSSQTSSEFFDGSMGTMTYFLVDAMEKSRGSVRMEETFEYCKAGMQVYFEELEKRLGKKPATIHQPFMINYCTDPVYFKP